MHECDSKGFNLGDGVTGRSQLIASHSSAVLTNCGFLVICASPWARLRFVANPYDEYRSFVRRLWPTGVVRA
jgi:hypothetical protein